MSGRWDLLVMGLGEIGKDVTYNWRMSISVRPAGRPVSASCLALRSYAETARLLNLGCDGSADATAASPATAPMICLTEGMV